MNQLNIEGVNKELYDETAFAAMVDRRNGLDINVKALYEWATNEIAIDDRIDFLKCAAQYMLFESASSGSPELIETRIWLLIRMIKFYEESKAEVTVDHLYWTMNWINNDLNDDKYCHRRELEDFITDKSVGYMVSKARELMEAGTRLVDDPMFGTKTIETNGEVKPNDYLIDGVIPESVNGESKIGFLCGSSSTYKSFIAVAMASALVDDGKFMGNKVKHGCKVMYVSGESAKENRNRFRAQLGDLTLVGDRLATNGVEFAKLDGYGCAEFIKCFKPDLIVWDTMNSIGMCENNNDSGAVSRMFNELKEFGCTSVIVHHTTKEGSTMEGSHALFSNADFVMKTQRVESDYPQVDLTCTKVKSGKPFGRIELEMKVKSFMGAEEIETLVPVSRDVMIGARVKGGELTEYQQEVYTIIKHCDEPMSKGEIHEACSKSDKGSKTTQNAISALVAGGYVESDGDNSQRVYSIKPSA